MLDAGLDIATTAVKCALNFSPVDKIYKVAKYAKKALDYVGNIKKADDCNTGANALLAVFKGGCPPPDPKKRNPRRDDGGGGGKGRLRTGTGASADPNSKSGNTLDDFLPPNRQAPEGEGWISYRIQQKATVKNNDTIRNRAAIYFDANPPIFTDYWINRIDDEQPNSRVNANSVRINDTTVNLTITGMDNLSGIRYYAIYLSINDSAYTRWKIITEPTLRFTGKIGKKYKFYSIAVDGVGYIEDAPLNPIANPDAVIQLTTDVFDIPTEGVKIAAYPNPTAAGLSIDFDVQKPCALTWQIIDPLGRLVYQKKYEKPTIGLFQDSWQTQSMPKGLYLLHVLIDNKSFSKKIVLN